MKGFFLSGVFFLLSIPAALSQSPEQKKNDVAILFRAEKALTDVIVHDIFSPPVASRIYVYANIAAYEVLAKTNDSCKSLYGRLHGMPEIAAPTKKISFPLAAVYAFLLTSKKLVFSESLFEDSIRAILTKYQGSALNSVDYQASLAYGKQVSEQIIDWSSKDSYKETRKLRRYQFLRQEGKWIPTPPGYMAAVEPYWSRIRTLVLDSGNQFKPIAAEVFSKEAGSRFYKQAYEVFETGKNLTKEQKQIADFWDCNPFFLNTEGHLNFATKKISPGGHWISIVGILSRLQNADLMKVSAAYTYSSIAMFDAFISCWDEKYRSNVIRPETFIDAYIDESWRPLLQTPPFPEYTSGHSVISTVAAIVLTRLFGDNLHFTDDSELEYGLPQREFSSIIAASREAAISRLYGGIHYRAAIENGQQQGNGIGKYIVERLINDVCRYQQPK